MQRVVIIDNDKLSVEALSNVLSREGFIVHKAYDGIQGLEAVRSHLPNVVLLDLFMPEIDGRRLCQYLKADDEFADVKVIVLSPLTLDGTVQFMDTRPDAYVAKGYIMDVADNVVRILKLLGSPAGLHSFEDLALGFEGRAPRVVVVELLEARKHYEEILYNVGDGIIEVNADDIVIYANPAAVNIVKKPELKIVGHNIVDVLGKRYDGQFQEILFRLKHSGAGTNQQTAMTHHEKTLELNLSNIVSADTGYKGSLLILQDVTYLTERIRELTLLNDVGQLLTSTLDFDEVLHILMSQIQKIMRVEAVSLLLVEKDTKDLIFEVALGIASDSLEKRRLPAGKGLVGWVVETGKSVLIPDVSRDERFDKAFDETTGFVTKSMLCVPLKIRNEVFGVIQVLNHADGRPFNEDNLYLLSSIAMYASISIEHASLYQERVKRSML